MINGLVPAKRELIAHDLNENRLGLELICFLSLVKPWEPTIIYDLDAFLLPNICITLN